MNKFFSKIILPIKLIVSTFLVYFVFYLYDFNDSSSPGFSYEIRLGSALLVLFFVALPVIFVFFLKNRAIARYPKFAKIWKFIRVIYIVLLIIFLGFVVSGFYRLYDKNKTNKAIDFINSKKITLSDVMGQNLPPKSDQELNDLTVAGIDANNNFIRDDVELAIFEKYPDSAKIRAAELQYAQALQLELTQVFNSGTFVPTLQKEDYGSLCISETVLNEELKEVLMVSSARQKEVEDMVFNTNIRKEKHSENLKKYLTTYLSKAGIRCDINFSVLPN